MIHQVCITASVLLEMFIIIAIFLLIHMLYYACVNKYSNLCQYFIATTIVIADLN